MAELKEFAGELKALPNISRHISLAEELSRRIARPGFRDRVTVEQALLDGHSLDSTAETLEVRSTTACLDSVPAHTTHTLQNTTASVMSTCTCSAHLLDTRGAGLHW